jgi:predicted RNase H-like HicB family nuclease
MPSQPFSVHCLIEREQSLWVGHCIELGISVQGDSVEDVRDRLHIAAQAYVDRVGELVRAGDKAGARQLLARKAPAAIRLKYHWANLLAALHIPRNGPSLWADQLPNPLTAA